MSRNAFRIAIPLTRVAIAKKLTPNVHQPARSILSFRPFDRTRICDDVFRQMDRQFERMERDMNGILRGMGVGRFRDMDMDTQRSRTRNQSTDSELGVEGNGKYTLNLDIGDIPSENIKISIKDKVVIIEAKREQTSEDGTTRVYQEITRKFALPDNIDTKEVKSVLTPEGILRIEAPLPEKEASKPKEIPIETEKQGEEIENAAKVSQAN